MISDLFSLENQVGDYKGPRLGYAVEGESSDFVYSPGFAGLLKDRAGIDREGGVYQLGGSRIRKVKTRRQQQRQRQQKRKRSTRRRSY